MESAFLVKDLRWQMKKPVHLSGLPCNWAHPRLAFDTFDDEAGRSTHLSGPIATALMANAAELLAENPQIEHVDILGAKLPQWEFMGYEKSVYVQNSPA